MSEGSSSMPQRKAIDALIMKGGGVKGLALAGAIQELERYFEFNTFVGTSAGAIAAILLASGATGKDLEQEIRGKPFRDFLDGGWWKWWNLIAHDGLHPGHAMTTWVQQQLYRRIGQKQDIKMSALPKRAVVFAVKSNGAVIFDSKGERSDEAAHTAARASAAMPFIFTPESVDSRRAYDGGMVANYPVQFFLDLEQKRGAPTPTFIAIFLGPPGPKPLRRRFFPLELMDTFIERDDAPLVDKYRSDTVLIDPGPIRTTDFDLTEPQKNFLIMRGRAAALRFLREKGLLEGNEADQVEQQAEKLLDVLSKAPRPKLWRGVVVAIVLLALIAGGRQSWYRWFEPRRQVSQMRKKAEKLSFAGLHKKAVEAFTEAIAAAKAAHSGEEEMILQCERGAEEQLLGDHTAAVADLRACEALAVEIGCAPSARATALRGLAESAVITGNNELGRRLYGEALSLFHGNGDRVGEAYALLGRGALEQKLGNNKRARQDYADAHCLSQKEGDTLGEANARGALAYLEQKLGNNNLARQYYEEARGLFQKEGSLLGEGNVLRGLGDLQTQLGHYDRARRYYGEAHGIFQKLEHRLGEANVLIGLGHLEVRLGNYEVARQRYGEALGFFQKEGTPQGEARVLMGLGNLELGAGSNELAHQHYTAALVLSQKEGDRLGQASALGGLADVANRLGKNDLARQSYGGALDLFQKEESRLGQANVLVRLGELEVLLGNYEEAWQRYGEARGLFRQLEDRLGEAMVLQGLGDLEVRRGNGEPAQQRYGDARDLFRQLEDRQDEGNVLQRLGDLHLLRGNYERAGQQYTQALGLFQQLEDRLGEANVLRGRGELNRLLGNSELARQDYAQALGLFQKAGSPLGEANVLLSLGLLERRLGNYEPARQRLGEARGLYRKMADRLGEANVLLSLGDLETLIGNKNRAQQRYAEARILYETLGMRDWVAYIAQRLAK